MLSDSCTQKDKIHLHLFKSRLFILGQKACLNYIITKARWASFWSSRMKSSPITSNAKNMGSAAEKRIKSILWSNLRQCSNNKEESNGKIIVLPNITHPASSMESYLVMTTAWSKRSPWTEVRYLCLNLLQAGVTGELIACHDRHSVRFGKRWQKLCQKLKSWQQIRSDRRTSLPVDGIFFLPCICVTSWHVTQTPKGYSSRMLQQMIDLHMTRSAKEALICDQILIFVR